MSLWKKIVRIFHSHSSQPSQSSAPSALIQQQQQIQAALRRLEAERNKQISILKQEASRLLEKTRDNYDKITEYSLLSTIESNSKFKEKEAEFQEARAKLVKIKSTLEAISQGDCSKINELKNDPVFNEIFPKFNFKLYAAQAGLPPEHIKDLSGAEVKVSAEDRQKLLVAQKPKETAEYAKINLHPDFKPLTDRPLVERIAAVHTFCTLYKHLWDHSYGLENVARDTAGFASIMSTYNNKNDMCFIEGHYFTVIDNISRIAQLVINQCFDKAVIHSKKTVEITKAYSLSMIAVKQALRKQSLGGFNFTEEVLQGADNGFYDEVSSYFLLAGLVRRVCEKGSCGDDIRAMLLKASKLCYGFRYAFLLLYFLNNPKLWDKRKEWMELRMSNDFLNSVDVEEWINLVTSYEQITKSGRYPIGDLRILLEAKLSVANLNAKLIVKGRIASYQELERIESNLYPVFMTMVTRPLIERLGGKAAFDFYHCNSTPSKGFEFENALPHLGYLLSSVIPNYLSTFNNVDTLEDHFFTSIDNLSRIAQLIINQCMENVAYENKNVRGIIKAFSLAMITLEQALNKRNIHIKNHAIDEEVSSSNKAYMTFSPYVMNLTYTMKGCLFAGMARRIIEKGNYGENIRAVMLETYYIHYIPIIPHVERLIELSRLSYDARKTRIKDWQAKGFTASDPEIKRIIVAYEKIEKCNDKAYLDFVKILKSYVKLPDKKEIMEIWQSSFECFECVNLLAAYEEIMLSGRYPLGDPKILFEAQELEARRKAKLVAKQQEKDRSLDVRTAGVALFQCALQGLPLQDLTYLATEYKRLVSTLNFENNASAIEADRLSRIAQDVIEQVMIDLRSKNHPHLLTKALTIASIAVLHAVFPELSEEETNATINAALFSGMARRLYEKKKSENASISIKHLLEEIHTSQATLVPCLKQMESLLKLSQAPYGERLKIKKELEIKKLAEFELEWADLSDAYIKMTQARHFPIGDARILVEAEILRQSIEEEQPFRNPLLESPFTEELPSLTESWRTHHLQFKDQDKWEIRIVTPEVLAFEAQQGRTMMHQHRHYLIDLIRSKLTTPVFSEPLRFLEAMQLKAPLLLESPHLELEHALVPSTTQNVGFNFPQTEGLYFLECRRLGENAKLYSKSVYVRNTSFLTAPLPEAYVCGKPQILTFKTPLSGQFIIQQGRHVQSQNFNMAPQIEFTLTKPGVVHLSIQLQDYKDCVESQTATVYHPQNEGNQAFRVKETKEGLSFLLGNENIADLNPQGQIELWEKPILPKTESGFNTKYKEHFTKISAIFENCSRKEQLAKIMMICQRLLPQSLMFGPFLSIAGCLNQSEETSSIDQFVTLLCQQVALNELMQQEGLKKTSQFIESHRKAYPTLWSTFFVLTHHTSERQALKGLFLQTLQMHFTFLKSNVTQLSAEPLFKLTHYLFALRSPAHSDSLNEDLKQYFQEEHQYEQWLSEVNAVLGIDKKSLQKPQKVISDLLTESRDRFHIAQTKRGDIHGRQQSDFLEQGVQTGQHCLQGIAQIKEHYQAIESGYAQNQVILRDALIQTNQRISEHYALAYHAEQDARSARKHARRKRRTGMIRNVVGLAVGAFLAPMIAPMLVKAGGLALAATKGAIAGSISSCIGGRNIIKGTLQGAAFAGFGFQAGEWIKPFEFMPVVSESAIAGATALLSTAVYGGKVIPNLLVGVGTTALTHFCIEAPEQGASQTLMREARDTLARTAIIAGVTTVCHRTDLGVSLISASLGAVQGLADKQGVAVASRMEQQKHNRLMLAKPTGSAHPISTNTPKTQPMKPKSAASVAQKEKPKNSQRIASARKEALQLRQEQTHTSSGMDQFLREETSQLNSFATPSAQPFRNTSRGISGFFIRSAQAGSEQTHSTPPHHSQSNRLSYKDISVRRQIEATVAQQRKTGLKLPTKPASEDWISSKKRSTQLVFPGVDQQWLDPQSVQLETFTIPLTKQQKLSFSQPSDGNRGKQLLEDISLVESFEYRQGKLPGHPITPDEHQYRARMAAEALASGVIKLADIMYDVSGAATHNFQDFGNVLVRNKLKPISFKLERPSQIIKDSLRTHGLDLNQAPPRNGVERGIVGGLEFIGGSAAGAGVAKGALVIQKNCSQMLKYFHTTGKNGFDMATVGAGVNLGSKTERIRGFQITDKSFGAAHRRSNEVGQKPITKTATIAGQMNGLTSQFERHKLIKDVKFKEINIGASKPAEIHHGFGSLSKRQTSLLDNLPKTSSRTILSKSEVSVTDLAALTAKTGDEFAMFTLGGRRIIIRGNKTGVSLRPDVLEKLKSEGWRWSAHTHPGTSDFVLCASGTPGDRELLKYLQQERSLILNSAGRRNIFDNADDLHLTSIVVKKSITQSKS